MKHVMIVPSLLMAAGVIASTAVAVIAAESKWLVLAAPLVMALAMVVATRLAARRSGGSRGSFRLALILGTVLLVATAIVAFADSSSVAMLMPILAGGVAFPVVSSLANSLQTDGKCARGL